MTTSGVPIYRQLMDQINGLIASGRLKKGMFLPSIREAGKELEINPMTVSKAYSLLERDGVLKNRKGQGMEVIGCAPPRMDLQTRKEILQPLMEHMILNAQQLSLNRRDVFNMLDALWKEKES